MDASAPLPQTVDAFVDDSDHQLWLALRAIRVGAPTPRQTPESAVVHTLRRAAGPADDEPIAVPDCVDGDLARHFEALAAMPSSLAVLRRLVLHVDADLAPLVRVALHRSLWRVMRASSPGLQRRAGRLFDERHAGLLRWCELPWSDPLTQRRLSQAHLPGVATERLEWKGPPDAAFVIELLSGTKTASDEIIEARESRSAHDGCETVSGGDTSGMDTTAHATHRARADPPLDEESPAAIDPASMLIGLQACLQGMAWGSLDDHRLADVWRQATLDVAVVDPSLRRDALRTLFMLAMARGDAALADRALADCVREQAHHELTPAMLRRWLDGNAGDVNEESKRCAVPLQLVAALDARWCRPQALHSASFRAALANALRLPASLARLHGLERALGDPPSPPQPLDFEEKIPASVLRALTRLDTCRQRLAAHRPAGRSAASLLRSEVLASEAVAPLQRRLALQAVAAGDAHAAGIAFAAARAAGCVQSSSLLQRLLVSIDEPAWTAAADTTGDRWWHITPEPAVLGNGWRTEEPIWLQLARHGSPTIASIAAYQLAVLYTDGCLQPCTGAKRSAGPMAHGLWSELRSEPAYEAEATRRLDSLAMQAVAAHGFQHDGLDWLCVPAAMTGTATATRAGGGAGVDRLLIVFTGDENRHGFDALELVNGFAGHHLLFLHDPQASGYRGETFDRQCDLVRAHVGPLFEPSQVTCHGNGAGAAGALAMARRFGFQAVVANPALLAAGQSADEPDTADAPATAFERSAVCVAVGARPAHREAFARWLSRARRCREARFIVEKFDDEGDDLDGSHLLRRVASKAGWPSALSSTIDRLDELRALRQSGAQGCDADDANAPTIEDSHAEVPAALLDRFWERLDEAPRLKLEIVVEGGRVFVADSQHTGTNASTP